MVPAPIALNFASEAASTHIWVLGAPCIEVVISQRPGLRNGGSSARARLGTVATASAKPAVMRFRNANIRTTMRAPLVVMATLRLSASSGRNYQEVQIAVASKRLQGRIPGIDRQPSAPPPPNDPPPPT